jgi:hypothetical protein
MPRSTPVPDETTIESWLAGELTEEKAREVERYFEAHPPEENILPPELLRAVGDLPEMSPEVDELVRRVRTRDTIMSSIGGREWRDILGPSEDPGILGTLGPYNVREIIAEGGMATVLKGHDPKLERLAALKVLSPDLATNGTARDRFLREARLSAALEHENILPIYGVYEDAVPWFAMRYIGGDSLQGALDREEAFDFARLRSITLQVARALGAAHGGGIVHRDIKPGNILFDEDGEKVWVCDFGIARSTEDPALTYGGAVAGTPQYMSPEQVAGRTVDGRSDLFSLGSVLYHCATGQPAFAGGTSVAVMRNIAETEPPDARGLKAPIPAWYERLLGNLLAKDPRDRFASAAEVVRAVEAQRAPRPLHRVRRRRRLFALAGILLVLGVALQIPSVKKFANGRLVAATGRKVVIVGRLGVFPDLEKAVAAAHDGDIIEIHGNGELAVEIVTIPAGRSLTLRAADGASPVLANIGETAHILTKSPLIVENLTFRPRKIDKYSLGCLWLEGSGNILRNCIFEASDAPANPKAAMRARIITLSEGADARIEGCRFYLTEAIPVLVWDHRRQPDEIPPTRIAFVDSVLTGSRAVDITWVAVGGGVEIRYDRCLVATDSLLHDFWNHPLPPVAIEARATCFAPRFAYLWMPRETYAHTAGRIRWDGENNLFRSNVPFFSNANVLAIAGARSLVPERSRWLAENGSKMLDATELDFGFPGPIPDAGALLESLGEAAPEAVARTLRILAR